ncbi:MAG TPA: hypothetical protein VN903_33130 [Polyangia bacterium]|nr:hypothetical protein [Polyangia bacterium]
MAQKQKTARGNAAVDERALRARALAFHRVLADQGVYSAVVSEDEFLAKVGPTILETATSVAKGQENGSLELLALPVTLLYTIKDWVPTIEWDYEFGLDSLFEDLGPMFEKAGSSFTWKRVEGDRDRYEYTLDGQALAIEPSDPVEIDFRDFAVIVKEIEGVLAPKAKKIFQPVTGDQSGRLLVIPTSSEAALREILIAGDDPRAEEFY